MSDLYTRLIRNMRVRVGEVPRVFSKQEDKYLRIKTPAWCRKRQDQLLRIYQDAEMLLRHGSVNWAALVQCNTAMYAPGPADHPGTTIYCSEPHWHDDLNRLDELARRVADLRKGQGATPDEKQLG